MATQLAEQVDAVETVEQDTAAASEGQSGDRDYESEARKAGWVPKDEFRGDPNRWTDAEAFVRKADEVMPILRKKVEVQDRRIADLEKTVRQQTKLLSSAEKRSYDRAVADLKARQEEAVESGDINAFRAVDKEIKALEKDVASADDDEPKPKHTQEQALEAWDDWCEANSWYDRGGLASASELEADARIYAERMTKKHLAKTDEMAPTEFFGFIGDLVHEKFPDLKNKPARPKPGSPVAAPTNGRGGAGGKTFSDLTRDAQQMCDKLFRMKALPGKDLTEARAYYVKSADPSLFGRS